MEYRGALRDSPVFPCGRCRRRARSIVVARNISCFVLGTFGGELHYTGFSRREKTGRCGCRWIQSLAAEMVSARREPHEKVRAHSRTLHLCSQRTCDCVCERRSRESFLHEEYAFGRKREWQITPRSKCPNFPHGTS